MNNRDKIKELEKMLGKYHLKIKMEDGTELDVVPKEDYDEIKQRIDKAIELIKEKSTKEVADIYINVLKGE